MKKQTQCVHSGTIDDDKVGGINSPIYTSSAFNYLNQDDVAYPRYFNTPNQKVVVDKICALEGAGDGVLFSSGMAAISTTILAFAGVGDHVVMMDELYGGTHAFATHEFKKLGLDITFALTSAQSICDSVNDKTRLIVIESPTNPLLGIVDIRKVAEFARQKGIVTIIDNTFATPINQTPLTLGIDIVVHSGTKYMGGHSDICCGIAVTTTEKAEKIRSLARCLGGSLNAMTCYLLERSLKTLAIRVQCQTQNAMAIAQCLDVQPGVSKVNYPGLEGSAGYDIAKIQMSGYGAMLSFELDHQRVDVDRFVNALKLIKPAVSLGGVESTICSPAVTSHIKMSAAERQRIGVSDYLLRLSVGIEQIDDLIEDLSQALKSA